MLIRAAAVGKHDLPACHPCYWTGSVPDSTDFPGWLDSCANVSQDWQNLCTVPD